MSREEENKFIRETMADIAEGLDGYEILAEDTMESILQDEDKYEIVKEDIESILPDEGYEIVEEDTGRVTMADLVAGLEGNPVGDTDKDSMASIANEITTLEAKINIAKDQRAQIADRKRELSKVRGQELATQRNGISR